MQLKKLGSFAIVAALAAGSVGCVVRGSGHLRVPVTVIEVEEEPPPPRVYVRDTRAGYVFIQGRWDRRGSRWDWRDGYWERERAGSRWEDGRWERRGRGHVWVEGRWSAGGAVRHDSGNTNVQVRDYREDPGPKNPPDGRGDPGPKNPPNVRDHRDGPGPKNPPDGRGDPGPKNPPGRR